MSKKIKGLPDISELKSIPMLVRDVENVDGLLRNIVCRLPQGEHTFLEETGSLWKYAVLPQDEAPKGFKIVTEKQSTYEYPEDTKVKYYGICSWLSSEDSSFYGDDDITFAVPEDYVFEEEKVPTISVTDKETTHSAMVAKLAKRGEEILGELLLVPEKMDLLHMAVGISGESGELLDAVKKSTMYDRPLDRVNVIEELGDLEFYMEGLRQAVGVTREETLKANIEKLSIRYPGFDYSNEAAELRADKEVA